jgi:glycerol-3-phosphate dehydrogenase
VLLRAAPHLIRPMRFVLPVTPGMRPRWMLRFGLFIYDHLGGRRLLSATRTLDLARDALGAPLQGRYRHGFEYSDCYVDDSRLVVLNALDAAERGAIIRTRTRCVRAERGAAWRLVLEIRGRRDVVSARVLVNATGPWVGTFGASVLGQPPAGHFKLVAGSHIVVPRLFDHDRAYILQTPDRRVVFALPFEHDFTLVGTTDREFSGDPGSVAASADEVDYLCTTVNDHFRTAIGPASVKWAFAGVRALYGDVSEKPQDVSRDYVLELDRGGGQAPLLTVYGGKITTYRRLAEAACEALAPIVGARPSWTKTSVLPGGDFPADRFAQLVAGMCRSWPFLTESHARRLARAYGTRATRILGTARTCEELGPMLGADLTGAEVRYLMVNEFAQTEDDVLWRRSKLGLRFSRESRARLATFMAGTVGSADR